MTEFITNAIAVLTPTYLTEITLLSVAGILVVGLIMLVGGGDRSARSMDDVYARRERVRARRRAHASGVASGS